MIKEKKMKEKRNKVSSMNKSLVGTEESAGVVIRTCSINKDFKNLRKIHRKTPVPESLLIRSATLLKNDSIKDFSM